MEGLTISSRHQTKRKTKGIGILTGTSLEDMIDMTLLRELYHIVEQTPDKVEVSFVRNYNANTDMVPLSIDKRVLLLRGNHGFYNGEPWKKNKYLD